MRSCKTSCWKPAREIILPIILLALFLPAAAFAACASPAGNAGDFMYNRNVAVYQYCNGTAWVEMGPAGTGGGNGYNGVFVISTSSNGNLTSVANADALCQAASTAGGSIAPAGTYKP